MSGQPIRTPRDARGDSCYVLSMLTRCPWKHTHHKKILRYNKIYEFYWGPQQEGTLVSQWSSCLSFETPPQGDAGCMFRVSAKAAPGGRGINSPRLDLSSQITLKGTKGLRFPCVFVVPCVRFVFVTEGLIKIDILWFDIYYN